LGDSDWYISRIAYFKDHNLIGGSVLHDVTDKYRNVHLGQNGQVPAECIRDYYRFYGITSSLILGKLAFILSISAEKMFQYNFYLGIFLAGLMLYLFLKKIGTNHLNIVVGFLIFSFLSGNAHSHGFFWVGPSFYCVLLWLLTSYVLFFVKRWWFYLPFCITLLLFSNPASLISIGIICLSVFLNGLMERDLRKAWKKIGLTLACFIFIFGSYKILLAGGMKYTLFGEDMALTIDFIKGFPSFDFKGMENLWKHTQFRMYFDWTNNFTRFFDWEHYGSSVILTGTGIMFCIVRKRFALLSLFIPTFIATVALSLLHWSGSRLFEFLLPVLLLIVVYGIQECIMFVWRKRKVLFDWRMPTILRKVVLYSKVLAACLVVIMAYQFVMGLMIHQAAIAQTQKIFAPRVWRSEAMASFIEGYGNGKEIFYFGDAYKSSALLSLDGWWDKKIYLPCMMPLDANIEYFERFLFIGGNYKIYKRLRSGFGVVWPKEGRVALYAKRLTPGHYRIVLSDTAIKREAINVIQLEYEINGSFKNISSKWEREPLAVKKYSTREDYPPLLLPVYSRAIKIYEGYLTVRRSNRYRMDFYLPKEADSVYLNNMGDMVSLMGKIEVFATGKEEPVFTLDLDWGETGDLKSKTGMIISSKKYPLLWRDPRFNIKASISSHEEPVPLVFEIEGNLVT